MSQPEQENRLILSLAPMEELTGHPFRTVHAECFGPLDRYYTPFLTPPPAGRPFFERYSKEVDPEVNRGLDVVPQLLTKNADDFVWAAHQLAEMGYREINLNLGCPSRTVVAKGKGSGFLRDLQGLDAFLSDVCERSPVPVSVKTRLGVRSDDEYERLLELYCGHPLAELIVHPRVQADRYQGKPRWEPYGKTLERAPFPVAYNGDVFSTDDLEALVKTYPQTRHVMLGRGILANPALARMIRGRNGRHRRRAAALPRPAVRRDQGGRRRQGGLPHEGVVVLRPLCLCRPGLGPQGREDGAQRRRV